LAVRTKVIGFSHVIDDIPVADGFRMLSSVFEQIGPRVCRGVARKSIFLLKILVIGEFGTDPPSVTGIAGIVGCFGLADGFGVALGRDVRRLIQESVLYTYCRNCRFLKFNLVGQEGCRDE
jgi:hypothetical protein